MDHTTQPLGGNEQGAEAPVMLNASFAIRERGAALRIWGATPHMIITTIHEGHGQIVGVDFGDPVNAAFSVLDQDTITIIARYEGSVFANQTYEVSLRQAERVGILLVQCGGNAIALYQEREEDRAAMGLPGLFVDSSLIRDFEAAEVVQ